MMKFEFKKKSLEEYYEGIPKLSTWGLDRKNQSRENQETRRGMLNMDACLCIQR